MLLLTGLALIVQPGTTIPALLGFARLALGLQVLLGAGAIGVLATAAAQRWGGGAAAAAVVLALACNPWTVYTFTDGLESALTLLALAALLWSGPGWQLIESPAGARDVAFGALLSLAVLARLDAALLCVAVGIVGIVTLWRDPRRLMAKGLAWGLPPVLTMVLYLVVNSLAFDTAMPISGAVKTTFPRPGWNGQWLLQHAGPLAAGAFVAIAAPLLARHAAAPGTRFLLRVLGLHAGLHVVYTLLFMDWAVHSWHFTAYWPTALLLAGLLAARWGRAPVALAVAAGLLLGAAGQWHFLHGREARAFQARSLQAAGWARENIPAGRVMAMSDCGVFGYYRGGMVMNLDGVVNNRAYQDRLHTRGLAAALAHGEVGYVVHHAVPAGRVAPGYGRYEYRRESRLHRSRPAGVALAESDELWRSAPFNDGSGERVFVIWRYRGGERLAPGVRMPAGRTHMP
jgi:hypothetical protein